MPLSQPFHETPLPDPSNTSGVILCGGAGRRMGGVDKSWLVWRGRPLLAHAIERLAPQVRTLGLSVSGPAERHAALGLPLWPDRRADRPGPLAGWEAALAACETPWLLSVPCDAPHLPLDLAPRLAQALQPAPPGASEPLARLCIAVTPGAEEPPQPHPVFALLHRSLLPAITAALDAGEHRVGVFAHRLGARQAQFADPCAFLNLNTPADWTAAGAGPESGA